MIRRYFVEEMRKVWDGSLKKFYYWLLVEITVLAVRERLGQVPEGTTERIKKRTWVDELVVRAIERRDKFISHDLNAFLEIMRLQIAMAQREFEELICISDEDAFQEAVTAGLATGKNSADAGWFHDGMTSYDTEEPATAMLYRDGCGVIMKGLAKLRDALRERARRHRGQVMIGRTHGQHAQPITFGIKCAIWYSMVRHAMKKLQEVSAAAEIMKLSGAVGVYGTIDPQVERLVGEELRLTPVAATQIVPLDYRVRVTNEFTVIAGVLEKIANDLWLMHQTEVGEICEPFGSKQKGSSAMPHKKNPIMLENVRGSASSVRGSALAMLEQIATSHERDISHSVVERIDGVDCFGMVMHMIQRLTKVVEGMEVFPDRMLANLEMGKGVFASQRVSMLLIQHGMQAEAAYRFVQGACYKTRQHGYHLRDVLLIEDTEVVAIIRAHEAEFEACFDPKTWVQEEGHIYRMAGID
jgi:adenylosuccinate lyase